MRTTRIELKGKSYILCYSLRAADNINNMTTTERGGLYEVAYILSELMQAGEKYAKVVGEECAKALSVDDILDGFEFAEISGLQAKINESINLGAERKVKLEDDTGKNVPTTQE